MIDSPDPLLGRGSRARGGSTAVLDPRPRTGGDGPRGPRGPDDEVPGEGDGAGGGAGPVGRGGRRRAVWLGTAAVICLGLLFVTVLPVRHYLQQRQDIDRAASALAQLEADNQALQDRVAELGTDAALEELARGQLHLVKPGEEAFAMLPPQFPSNLPPLFPYPLARRILEPRG